MDFIKKFKSFAALPETKNICLDINLFTELLKLGDGFFDPVTDRQVLMSGCYGNYLGKPIFVSKWTTKDRIFSYNSATEFSVSGTSKCHSVDGPAIIYEDGEKQYWLNGKQYSFEEWERRKNLQIFE